MKGRHVYAKGRLDGRPSLTDVDDVVDVDRAKPERVHDEGCDLAARLEALVTSVASAVY
jgi:hypothetical protein